MMWWVTLSHKLFGTHWVAFIFASDTSVRRVRVLPNGKRCVVCYGEIRYLQDNGKFTDGRPYTPLTWLLAPEES